MMLDAKNIRHRRHTDSDWRQIFSFTVGFLFAAIIVHLYYTVPAT